MFKVHGNQKHLKIKLPRATDTWENEGRMIIYVNTCVYISSAIKQNRQTQKASFIECNRQVGGAQVDVTLQCNVKLV